MKSILVTGSAFVNRGSESMMFVAADELQKRFPKHEIIMLSPFDFRKDVSIYNFTILPDYITRYMPEPFYSGRKIAKKILRMSGNQEEEERYKPLFEDAVKRADFMINIGGYALSSQKEENLKKPWGTLCYLAAIMFCKKRKIPMYLMPQSFGPFEYIYPWKPLIAYLMRKYLKYPRLIFAREEDGFRYMKPYCREDSLLRINDTVLTNQNMNIFSVFKSTEHLKLIDLSVQKPVAVVPNMRCIDAKEKGTIISLYKTIIDELEKKNRDIYLLRHSKEDIELCRELKRLYSNHDNIHLLDNEFNCVELQYLLKQFEFVVASRFHAVIHSYLYGVPCLIIGWATKYYELASLFQQEKYVIDVREDIDETVLIKSLHDLTENLQEAKKKILEALVKVQEKNSYAVIEEEYYSYENSKRNR